MSKLVEEDIYVKQLQGFINKGNTKIKKALYDLKQAH